MRIYGFEPLLGRQPKVLVLGSMPSVASLEEQRYYAKPQNSFWRIMGELFAAGVDLDYSERVSKLTAMGVAVWDVLASCIRPGSLDSAIEMTSIEVNDFAGLFAEQPQLRHVFFNGRKAEQIYTRRVLPQLAVRPNAIAYHSLPSTSPAMAALSFEQKLSQWSILVDVLKSEAT